MITPKKKKNPKPDLTKTPPVLRSEDLRLEDAPRGPFSDKLPPQNIEAEQSVLGALMIDRNAIIKVSDFLKQENFYRHKHQIIYETMLEIYKNQEPIDLLSVASKLEEKKQLTIIGGSAYLASLANAVPTSAHVINYAKIVTKKKLLRDLIDASYFINELGFNEEADVDNVLDAAERRIFSISQKSLTHEFTLLKNPLTESFERIDLLHKKGGKKLRGISMGLVDLDNILSGLQRSDLIILASRPRIGKTSLALDIARNVAIKEKKAVGVFSLEMSIDQLTDRVLAQQAGVDLWKMRTGNLSFTGEYNDFTRIQEALGVLSEAPIFIDDSSSTNALQMKAMARRLQARTDLGLIIVDYLQLMEAANRSDNRVQEISEISRSLKGLARELNVPVIALSQLSRAVEHRSYRIPRLSDLRESGALEQDADVVLFIYREEREPPAIGLKNEAKIIVAKHRNGPTGEVDVYFSEEYTSFKSLEKKRLVLPEKEI